jgi:SurA-like N-terminal domain
MKRLLTVVLLFVCAGFQPVHAGEVLDRIIVIVNSTPILLSDWDESWRCEALLAGRAPESYNEAEKRQVFNRLVDQELLRKEMRSYLLAPVSPAAVEQQVKDARAQLSKGDDALWRTELENAGLREDELARCLRHQLEVERFVDARFRASIRIDDRAVARYYRDEFLPEVRKAGGKDVPLDQVSGKIREILVEQRMNEQLNTWLQSLREQADMQIPAAIGSTETEPGAIRSK